MVNLKLFLLQSILEWDMSPDAWKCNPRYLKELTRSAGWPVQATTAATGAGNLTKGLNTTITVTFVYAILISMCNVAE